MRLPRDLTGSKLVRALKVFAYEVTRQTGSHIRLTTLQHGEHHLTVPRHDPLRLGTMASILAEVARHFEMSRDEVVARLFGKGR